MFFSLALLAIHLIASVALMSVIAFQDARRLRNQLSIVTIALFTLFSVTNTLSLNTSLDQFALIRTVMFVTVLSLFFLYLLLQSLRSNARILTKGNGFVGAVALIVAVLSTTPLVFDGYTPGAPPQPSPGPLVWVFFVAFIWLAGLAVRELSRGLSKKAGHEAGQYRILLVGMLPILILAPMTGFVMPILFNASYLIGVGPLYTLFFIGCVAYAIVRHGLFDIRLAAVRTLAYVLSLLTLAGIYGIFALWISQEILGYGSTTGQNIVNIATALILAFIFQPIKRFFDRVTNRIFYKDQYDTNEFIARLGNVLTTTTDLRSLLRRAAEEIGTTLKTEQAAFFVEYSDGRHLSAGTKEYTVLSPAEFDAVREALLGDEAEIIVVELLPHDGALRKTLSRRGIAVMMLIRREGRVFGYLALGQQLSSGFTERDIRVLETISNELLIAIQNSLSAQEVRDVNVHLQERIKEATSKLTRTNTELKKIDKSKDEFISLASHQLRTPLTSVKGYLSMVLDGDLGKISADQRRVLEQAYDSSQRMVFLINDFLNVSRLQTGKFELEKSDMELVALTREEVRQLEDTARVKQIEIVYHPPSGVMPFHGDENKLRQVMMNFIDNAIYYSPSGTKIKVQLYKESSRIIFKVTDAGIGVPKAEQPKLFTKFFRATNARRQRPDGTGIGLYMAKKVIIAHGGAIIFESREGKGSTFGFRLPLKNDTN